MRRFFVYFAGRSSRTGKTQAYVHWMKKCYTCAGVEIRVPCKTHMRDKQPKMTMTGKADRFYMGPDDKAILE